MYTGEVTLTESALKAGRALYVEDPRHSHHVGERLAANFPAPHSSLAVPMVSDEKKLGAVIFARTDPRAFEEHEIAQAERAVKSIAVATAKAQAIEAETTARQQAESLQEAAMTLIQTLDLEKVLERVLDQLEKVISYDSATVFLDRKSHPQALTARGHPFPEQVINRKFPKMGSLVQKMGSELRALVLEDAQKTPEFQNWGGADYVRGWIGVPLISRDQLIGYMTLDSKEVGAFDDRDAELAQAFGNQAAIAMENARLFEELRAGQERLRRLSNQLTAAQESERRRLARELHDEVGQTLTGLRLMVDTVKQAPTEQTQTKLTGMQALVDELLEKVNGLSLDLRPAMLDDLGLLPSLIWHFQRYTEQTHIEVPFEHSGLEGTRFHPETEITAFRLVQEALTNAARHAKVERVEVKVLADEGTIRIWIEDEGVGFNLEQATSSYEKIGLSGMRERVHQLGGRLSITTAPGVGTELTAVFPLEEMEAKGEYTNTAG